MKKLLLLVLPVFFLVSFNAHALRCGHSLVQVGDRKLDVVNKCGEPDSIDQHYETRLLQNYASIGGAYSNNGINFGQQRYTEVQIVVDEWVYDFGRRRFQQFLRFENGVLTDITDLSRGH
jgi:hypothetical protein